MRKDELLYLHQLLAVVADELEHRGEIEEPAATTPVSSMAAHAPKGDHREAVIALASALATGLEPRPESDERPQPATS